MYNLAVDLIRCTMQRHSLSIDLEHIYCLYQGQSKY